MDAVEISLAADQHRIKAWPVPLWNHEDAIFAMAQYIFRETWGDLHIGIKETEIAVLVNGGSALVSRLDSAKTCAPTDRCHDHFRVVLSRPIACAVGTRVINQHVTRFWLSQ